MSLQDKLKALAAEHREKYDPTIEDTNQNAPDRALYIQDVEERAQRLRKSPEEVCAADEAAIAQTHYPCTDCLKPDEILLAASGLWGQLSSPERKKHYASCPFCLAMVSTSAPDDKLIADIARRLAAPEPIAAPLFKRIVHAAQKGSLVTLAALVGLFVGLQSRRSVTTTRDAGTAQVHLQDEQPSAAYVSVAGDQQPTDAIEFGSPTLSLEPKISDLPPNSRLRLHEMLMANKQFDPGLKLPTQDNAAAMRAGDVETASDAARTVGKTTSE